MQEIQRVYKVVVENEDGVLVSRTAGGNGWGDCPELIYKEGEITFTPAGSGGIFVDETLDRARITAEDRSGDKEGLRIVHEAIPLGEKSRRIDGKYSGYSSFLRYPAILLGKEVWREEPKPEPSHSFKVGGSIKLKKGVHPKSGFGRYWKSQEDVGVIQNIRGDSLMTRFLGMDYEYTCYASEMELAPPEPEWVDVTRECELSLSSSPPWVSVRHGGVERVILAAKGAHPWAVQGGACEGRESKDYKVELLDGSYPCGCFRVLKKKS